MKFYEECYQKALEDISHNRLYAAKKKLETILENIPYHPETNWALGLVEASIGLPHSALNRWSYIDEVPASKIQLLESKLLIYEQLYNQYNESLRFIKNEKYEDALKIFEKILEHETQIPLPIEFYRGYYLLLLLKRKANLLLTQFSEAPGYIQASSEINAIKRKALRVKRTRKRRAGSLMAGAAVLVMSLGVLSHYDLQKETASPVIQGSVKKDTKSSPDLAKISTLEVEKSSLEAQLDENEKKLNNLESILALSQTNPEELSQRAAYLQYQEGRRLVSDQSYEEAIKVLQTSYELEKDSYFSDDNLYLLIKANQEFKDKEQSKKLIDLFFLERSNHFMQSPYYDDLLLAKAKNDMAEVNVTQAIEAFNFIIEKYPQSWTAIEAKRMKERVEEKE